jgi:tRNA threonylcarbamoyl adenosine modification protein YjeE
MLFEVFSLKETGDVAIEVAKRLKCSDVVLLRGDLGVGKTYFASCIINYFLPQEIVTSPTFNIVKEYSTKDFNIHHFDLYRIKKAEELLELDIDNCFNNGVSIIEWPEKAENMLYNVTFDISISIENENRIIKVLEK